MSRYNCISEEAFKVIEERVRSSTDARRTTGNGSSCEAAIQQTKSRRGESASSPLILSLTGPMVSGKNQVQLLWRNGKVHKFPNKKFTNWRARGLTELLEQKRPAEPITSPVHLFVDFWPADNRTRDLTGMGDALFHLLVKANVLKDDGLVWNMTWRRHELNRKFPKVVMELEAWQP